MNDTSHALLTTAFYVAAAVTVLSVLIGTVPFTLSSMTVAVALGYAVDRTDPWRRR